MGGPTAQAGLTVAPGADDTFDITGTVPTGESRTVTYTVRVKAYAAQGDHNLGNVLDCQPLDPDSCLPETTRHPVRSLVVTKDSDATIDSRPGDTVTYTVTAHNLGDGDYTAAEPATIVDDLTGVLDDADYQNDAASTAGDDPAYNAPRVRWAGPLASGDTVTITYTVILKGGGDGNVDNVAWAPHPGDPDGPTPDCSATPLPCDGEEFDLPKLSIQKTAAPVEVDAVGDVITYTVVVTNEGPGDYTSSDPASFSDDLMRCSTTRPTSRARRRRRSGRRHSPSRPCPGPACSPRVTTRRSPTGCATPARATGRWSTRRACPRARPLDAAGLRHGRPSPDRTSSRPSPRIPRTAVRR